MLLQTHYLMNFLSLMSVPYWFYLVLGHSNSFQIIPAHSSFQYLQVWLEKFVAFYIVNHMFFLVIYFYVISICNCCYYRSKYFRRQYTVYRFWPLTWYTILNLVLLLLLFLLLLLDYHLFICLIIWVLLYFLIYFIIYLFWLSFCFLFCFCFQK